MGDITAKKQEGMKAVVFTFNPSPSVLFSKVREKELTSVEEKRRIFESLGIDILVEFPLTYETAATPKELFVSEILVEKLNAKCIDWHTLYIDSYGALALINKYFKEGE